MASERLFQDHHLPPGLTIATNDNESSELWKEFINAFMAGQHTAPKLEPDEPSKAPSDKPKLPPHTPAMTEITRTELATTLSVIEERMDRRVERMEKDAERRSAEFSSLISLRDDQLRRELDLRQESFRAEQASRDLALNEKFSGFLSAQSERDKALEKISDARFDRIEKDVSSIKADAKKVSDEINTIKVTMAKYLGAAVVIGAIASAALGAAAKHFLGS